MGITAATQPTIHVAATTLDGTAAALRVALPLARAAAARLVVLVPRIVPYPIDHDATTPATFLERRYEELVPEPGGTATIDVCVCRRVDELDLNMATAYLRKSPSEPSRFGVELTAQAGEDTKLFGFSATAPNIGGAGALLHLGPTNVSYLAPVGKGLTLQGGIFSSLIGYDSLYAKDNFAYTRPWGADYTPYLMLGVNASYAA